MKCSIEVNSIFFRWMLRSYMQENRPNSDGYPWNLPNNRQLRIRDGDVGEIQRFLAKLRPRKLRDGDNPQVLSEGLGGRWDCIFPISYFIFVGGWAGFFIKPCEYRSYVLRAVFFGSLGTFLAFGLWATGSWLWQVWIFNSFVGAEWLVRSFFWIWIFLSRNCLLCRSLYSIVSCSVFWFPFCGWFCGWRRKLSCSKVRRGGRWNQAASFCRDVWLGCWDDKIL